MTRPKQRAESNGSSERSSGIGTVRARWLVFGVLALVLAVSLLSGVSLANEHGTVAVEQDGVCRVVDPVSTDQTAAEFYDYTGGSSPYSSHGTVQYQRNDTSILLFHDGPDGLSLVVVHDRYPGDANDSGTDGGVASFDVSGLPTEGEWTVEDDDYDDQTDQFSHEGTESELDWVWSDGRNDGAAFTGLEPGSTIRIDPAFNEDATLERQFEGEQGVISSWQAIDNTEDGFERRELSSLSAPVYIWVGSCEERPGPDASLDVTPSATGVGDTVTLDASATTSVRPIREYRWDLTGDGTADSTTAEPTLENAFNSPGTYDVSVTVVDEANGTGTANASVSVGAGGAPAAALNVTDNATVDETVLFDANASTVDEPPATYEWRVDGETVTTTNGSTLEYTFESSGERTVEVVVTDAIGRTGEATAEVAVNEPLSAALSVPEDPVAVGEPVTFDAGESTGDVSSFAWSFGDGNESTTNESTVEHSYDSAGEYTVSLTVSDAGGDTAGATGTVLVEEPSPTAAIDAPDEVTAGDTVTVDASDSVAAAGNLTYEWQVDGETVANGSDPAFEAQFNDSGSYTVSVVVTDGTTRSDTASTEVSVAPALTAVIETRPAQPTINESVTFDASNSTGEIDSYEWTLVDAERSDGNESDNESANRTAEGSAVTHTYGASGNYTVILTVTGGDETSTDSTTISVDEETDDGNDGEDGNDESGGNDGTEGGNDDSDPGGDPGGGPPSNGGSGGGAPSGGGSSGGGGGGSSGGGSSGGASTPEPAGPNFTVTDLEAAAAVVDRPFEITVTVGNTGDLEGNTEIPITVDGDERETISVSLSPGENVTRTVTTTVSESGTVDIEAGNRTTTTSVAPAEVDLEVTAMQLQRDRIAVGDDAVVLATVRNDGTIPGEYRAELAVSGSLSAVEVVRVMPGETERIRLTQRFEAPGTYNVSVADRSAELTVEGDETGGDAGDDSGATADGPTETLGAVDGFGVFTAILAVALATLAAVSRSRSS
ncbi:PKD domain-containing protein [Halobellus salinisoli]|uniref:PKD domain-containing protein n=1 Tax=Halobellus salinisoli TaxID=3108500 RepID=UPI00300B171D